MLAVPTEFPHPGSRAFVKGTAEPVTIIRRNADDSALIRRDPRARQRLNRDASGNRTEPFANLCATEDEAAQAGVAVPKRRRKARKEKA